MKMFKKDRLPAHLEDDLPLGKQFLIFGWEVVKVVVISLVIIIPVRTFLIKPFYVKGASMEPNFYDHQYLIIDEISYRFSDPERGDPVVFRFPLDPRQFFIKRVIGLPGEKIGIENGQVTITNSAYPEGIVLEENYLEASTKTIGSVEVQLGEIEYFLLGDNREASLDSRIFGPVSRSFIVGRTFLRGWPLNQFGIINHDLDYNL